MIRQRLVFAAALPVFVLAFSARAAEGPTTVPTFYTHESAVKLYHAAKYAEAESLCKQAIETIEKEAGKNSPQLAEPLIDLAGVYMRTAKFSEAKEVMDRAESLLDKSKPDQALLVGRLGINKGWRLYTLGEPMAAQKVFEESRDLIQKYRKGDSVDLAELINNLALMYEETAEQNEDATQIDQAKRMLLQAWQMRRRLTGDDSPETAESLNNLGMHLLFNPSAPTDADLAVSTLKKALDTAIKAYGPDNPETANAHASMALADFMHGQLDDAEQEIKIALPITQRYLGVNSPDRAGELTTLGRILQEQTDYEEAEKAFGEAVAINEVVFGKSHPNVISAMQNLKSFYDATGDTAKSDQIQKRIEKLSGKEI